MPKPRRLQVAQSGLYAFWFQEAKNWGLEPNSDFSSHMPAGNKDASQQGLSR